MAGAGLVKAAGSAGETIGKGLKNIGNNIKSMFSSKPGKIIATGGAVGGAVALGGAGAGLGVKAATEGIKEATNLNPFNNVLSLFKKDATDEEKKGAGTLISVGVVVGLVLLAVFVIIPQFTKGGK